MRHPDWYAFVLLFLAAFRTYRLIAEDTILDRPRAWVIGLSDWNGREPAPPTYREKLATWLTCHWCAGFWHAVAWWAAWWFFPHATLFAAAPWAISTLLALTSKNLDETQ